MLGSLADQSIIEQLKIVNETTNTTSFRVKGVPSKCCSPVSTTEAVRKESSNPAVSESSESKESDSLMNEEEEEKMREQAQKKLKVERSLRKSIALMRGMRNDGPMNIESSVDLQSMRTISILGSQASPKKHLLNMA